MWLLCHVAIYQGIKAVSLPKLTGETWGMRPAGDSPTCLQNLNLFALAIANVSSAAWKKLVEAGISC